MTERRAGPNRLPNSYCSTRHLHCCNVLVCFALRVVANHSVSNAVEKDVLPGAACSQQIVLDVACHRKHVSAHSSAHSRLQFAHMYVLCLCLPVLRSGHQFVLAIMITAITALHWTDTTVSTQWQVYMIVYMRWAAQLWAQQTMILSATVLRHLIHMPASG